MSLAQFQAAFAAMALNPRLAGRVRRTGAQALSAYDLTPKELRRLESVSRQPGMSLTCTLARANRFGPLHDAFPRTFVLLEPVLRELLDELWSGDRPHNYQLTGEDAAFAEFIEQKLTAGELQTEYLREIFLLEKTCWELAMKFRHAESATSGETSWIVPFEHRPGDLLDCLDSFERPPASLPRGDYQVRIRLVNGELQLDWQE